MVVELALSVLAITIFFVALESELLITNVKSAITALNLPEIFIGIIIIPNIGQCRRTCLGHIDGHAQ